LPFLPDQGSPPVPVVSTPPGHVVTQPSWLEQPTAQQLRSFFPHAATLSKVAGDATIRCQIDVTGALSDCTVTREAPTGLGFGEAAVAMASTFKMRPKTVDGAPVGGVVNIPIHFNVPGPRPEAGVPSWISHPSIDDTMKAYPAHASHIGLGGHVTMQCVATATGEMTDCKILEETPPGEGFGRAALALSNKFRLTPFTPQGVSVAGLAVDIPMAFRLGK
jgi:TonB family protein